MILTKQEKEKLVLDLYNQGKTIREIAKEARMSFRDIGAILKKASKEKEERERQAIAQYNDNSYNGSIIYYKGVFCKCHAYTDIILMA